ncbi:MAG: methylhydantoinase, partial [Proteobacteria bacterium]|nr:methylhydantoinase [Pseudomonadota bacterium]
GVNRVAVDRPGGLYHPLHLSKDQDLQLAPGDVIRVSTPGGGGYGNAFARPPQRVAADVMRGYYTAEQAETRFGVALDAGGAVDVSRTATLRNA